MTFSSGLMAAEPQTKFGGTLTGQTSAPEEPLSLWYRQPAAEWVEALAIGNGRLGAMVFGGIETERLQLNEDTLWGGGPYDPANPQGKEAMPEIQKLIFAGNYKEAYARIEKNVMARPLGQMPYQTAGDLYLAFEKTPRAENYRRDLNLDTAVASVSYAIDGVTYRREVFSSPVDQVIVMKLTASRPGKISFTAGMRTPQPAKVITEGDNTLLITGKNGSANGIDGALKFQVRARLLNEGGQVTASDDSIRVQNADAVTLLIAAATSYKSYSDVTGDPEAITRRQIEAACAKSYEQLKSKHIAEHQRLFRRVQLDLGSTPAAANPTDERIRNSESTDDPQLAALYFQFGRYLLISSSRPGSQPANLQGIWNDSMSPPWNSKYTININTEMNYWPAEVTNLSECAEPLFGLIRDISQTGRRTAEVTWGAGGWVCHHNTDLWRATAPIDGVSWGMWPTGGAWLCKHLWDRFEYTGDREFLAEYYPIMKGAAEFFLDSLVEDPTHGWLVTCPSISPENPHPHGYTICAGPTMDMQILRDLFSNCLSAIDILNTDRDLRHRLLDARRRLAPNQIGSAGQLQEWLEDWDMQAPEMHHRHVSHLYGLYPSDQINVHDTPDLAAAARKTLEIRGDNATGWGIGWRLNLWARLHDAEHTHQVLRMLLGPDRTYPNMFDAHPPFQIDGNFGGTSGIAEMLMQSRAEQRGEGDWVIELLPALPKAWPAGSVKGLRAKGGFELDIAWADGVLKTVTLRSTAGHLCNLRYGDDVRRLTLNKGETYRIDWPNKGKVVSTAPSQSSQTLRPSRPLCEYLANPVGIDITSPRLTWNVESDQRGQKQTAYRILVASSRDRLDIDHADLWDTGKVASDNTLHIPYEGKPLASYQRCFWKVRVWDRDGVASDWSEPASWSMGILSPDEWKGRWLGYHKEYTTADQAIKGTWKQKAPSPLLRKAFTLNKPVRSASVHVCGLGFHEVYLNGRKVGDHVLDPAFTRYDRACLYVTHDVTDMLKRGDNAVGVMLGNGWYNVFTNAAWDFNEAPWRDRPKMLLQLRVEYTDGTTELIASDSTWKATVGPVVLDGIRQGETYDARREMPGWSTAAFDGSGWQAPELVEAPKGTLRAQVMPAIEVIETIRPVKLTEPAPGVYLFDLGQNIAGWAQLTVSGPAGTQVQMRYGERLHADGTLDQKDIKVHTYEDVFQTDTYILKGAESETWEPRFVYHGFQHVEVTGLPAAPTLDTIRGRVVHTAFESSGEFRCSDDMLNHLQHCTLWAYRGNYHGYPTDCPHREKNGWTGDAHLAIEQGVYNWFNAAAYTKWMLDFRDEQKQTGELPGIIPTGGWGYAWGNGPAWDSAYLIIPWTMYQYYGDTRILETHFDRFKRYVDYLTSKAENGIVKIGLGDWAPAKTKTPEALTSTAFYYMDAMITSRAAQVLGRREDARKYADLAGQIKTAFNKTFYKGEGLYDAGSQTALSFPLHCGLVPESEQSLVVQKLVENIRSQNDHLDVGILGARAIFNVLTENGHHDLACRMIKQTDYPGYGDWVRQGATTLWEQWDGGASRNHIMYGDIGAWFYKYLAGICLDPDTSAATAFSRFVIRPRPISGMAEASAVVESIRGKIQSAWRIDDGTMTLDITVPANTTAVVYVPTKDAGAITESGKPAADASEVAFVTEESGCAVFTVQSGSYSFRSLVN